MFTGIVLGRGAVRALERRGEDMRLGIDGAGLDLADLRAGDSVAVNGVCLTALAPGGNAFSADVSLETLARTTLSDLRAGAGVNLELALLPTTRLGGHLVSGHVDGVGRVVDLGEAGRSRRLRIEVPAGLARYLAAKGSICVDGVSLTVNAVAGAEFEVNVIPHTLEQTVIGAYRRGTRVNLEVDLVARYIESLLAGRAAPAAGISREFLEQHGFVKDV
ncbi:MAG: riboflavin synthase [Gammaproteobacteria bacterium]|nr:riboflavin synthase [Gammaproteobacteria bacterium]